MSSSVIAGDDSAGDLMSGDSSPARRPLELIHLFSFFWFCCRDHWPGARSTREREAGVLPKFAFKRCFHVFTAFLGRRTAGKTCLPARESPFAKPPAADSLGRRSMSCSVPRFFRELFPNGFGVKR